jgi:hypothetical protein
MWGVCISRTGRCPPRTPNSPIWTCLGQGSKGRGTDRVESRPAGLARV